MFDWIFVNMDFVPVFAIYQTISVSGKIVAETTVS